MVSLILAGASIIFVCGRDSIRAQVELATIRGQVANERLGCAMAGSGTRWFVGARGAVPASGAGGAVYVMSWSSGGLLGYPVLGVSNGNFGISIAPMPGGGCIVGEPGATVPVLGQSGQARILGPTGATLAAVYGLNGSGTAGTAVAYVGDIDGNSVADYLVGQPSWTTTFCPPNFVWTGAIIVAPGVGVPASPIANVNGAGGCSFEQLGAFPQSISGIGNVIGGPGPEFAVGVTNRNRVDIYGWTTTPVPALVLHRSDVGPAGFGKAICSVGDINGNGIPDYAVGASNVREVRVLEGSTGNVIRSWVGAAAEFGSSLALLGDQDGNGFDELIIGAQGVGQDEGEVCVFSLAPAQEGLIAYVKGRSAGSRMGASVCRVPDQTGDGRDEIGVGAPGATVGGMGSAGEAVLFTLDPNSPNGGCLGTGCVGVGLVGPEPRVGTPLGSARIGSTFAFGTTHSQVGALRLMAIDVVHLTTPLSLAALFPGLAGCYLSVPLNLTVAHVTQSRVAALNPGLGYAEYSFVIPNNPSLVGLILYAQAYVADAGPPYPGSLSKACWARLIP